MNRTTYGAGVIVLLLCVAWSSYAMTPQEIAAQKIDFATTVQEFVVLYAADGQEQLAPVYPALQALQELAYLTPMQVSPELWHHTQHYVRSSHRDLYDLLNALIRLNVARERVTLDTTKEEAVMSGMLAILDTLEVALLVEIEDRLLFLTPLEAARLVSSHKTTNGLSEEISPPQE